MRGARLYSDLAWIWPIFSPPEDYREEAREIADLIEAHGRGPVRSLLHLGCGGGHLDSHLKGRFSLTGVDLSEAMLGMARRLNPEVRYLHGDMRDVRLEETFDAVLIADSIDYMLTEGDLRAAFETAHRHLRPGGILCTYAEETRERFEQHKSRVSTRQSGNVEITALEHAYDPDPDDTTYEMTFVYLIRRDGALTLELDRHQMGLFPQQVWVDLLEQSGFEVSVVEYDAAGPMFVGRRPGPSAPAG